MRILYGVQTTGNGHIVRSKSMIQALRDQGHEVYTILSGCTQKKILDEAFFQPCQRKKGLTFVVEKGRLCFAKTASQLNVFDFYRDIFGFAAQDFDLVITDYEPITARIARRNSIPSIGIGHLYAFEYDVPVARSRVFSTWVMKKYAPVTIPLGLHWHHFDQPILPPTIPRNIQGNGHHHQVESKILVYLPFEDLESVLDELRPLSEYDFFVYANVHQPRDEGHIQVRPFSRDGFVDDLFECSGVICNAGFSLISEALHLGKKIMTKPVQGQVEQESNGVALEELGLGSVVQEIRTEAIPAWFHNGTNRAMNFPDVISSLVDWIGSGDLDDYQDMVRQAWKQ